MRSADWTTDAVYDGHVAVAVALGSNQYFLDGIR